LHFRFFSDLRYIGDKRMANPIAFTPESVDPKLELQRRLAAAPNDHAEALLVAYELLDESHRQGILDALHGAIGARDTIFAVLAGYSAQPLSVNVLRNLIALGKLLGTVDPESIASFTKEAAAAAENHARESQPPSLWQLFKRMRRRDTRRGLSLLTSMMGALGRAAR
jgi:uncharacterized protein YjgD (DUF1641 family)